VTLSDGRSISMFENIYSLVAPSFATTEAAIGRAIDALAKEELPASGDTSQERLGMGREP